MSIALYRKYRPKTFSEISGQNHIKVTLQNEIESSRVAHAYLFCGPRGTGKTTMARLLSKSVNCLDIQAKGEPCNKCQSCEDLMNSKALDIIEIDAASHTGVDNVRENIIQNARFTPTQNKFKVFIIDEVHMLSISAFNALLKILEEPPKYVIFVLATTEVHKVPATIISRCQRFDFKKIVTNELVERLRWIVSEEGIKVEDKVLTSVAKQSGGCVRDAESLLEQILSLGEKNITLEQAELILPKHDYDVIFKLFKFIIKKQTGEAITLINKLVDEGVDVVQFADSFVEFVRNVLLYKLNNNLEELSRDLEETMVQEVIQEISQVPADRVTEILKKFLDNKDMFKQSYIIQLPLEIIIFELTQTTSWSNIAKQSEPKPEPQAKVEKIVMAQKVEIEEKKIENTKEDDNIVEMSFAPILQQVDPQLEEVNKEDVALEKPVEDFQEDQDQMVIVEPSMQSENVASLAEFLAVWPTIMDEIKLNNYGLYMSLRMGKPVEFSNQTIIIGFLFELQRQRLDSMELKTVLNQAIEKIAGVKYQIETKIDSSLDLDDVVSNGRNGNGGASGGEEEKVARNVEASVNDIAEEFDGEIL